ncbi:hypothetical protein K3495_g2430 [Podosphaera aphanis]|nr:hypothetical protein K3495_g2430 [Podosphaera aphanis]
MFKRVSSRPFRTSNNELDYKTVNITYEDDDLIDNDGIRRPILVIPEDSHSFSWLIYSIFVLLGIAMLWAWNMFLAAAPYFQSRFAENATILARFQPAITSISCVSGLCTLIFLTNLQSKANYPQRIISGLALVTMVFILLTISTKHFDGVTPEGYFIFTLIMVFFSACATGLFQNGSFALAAGFGRPEYTQAIMTGQGIAGVLPAVSQIFSVLATPESNALTPTTDKSPTPDKDSAKAAFTFFITATGVSFVTLVAVIPLVREYKKILAAKILDTSDSLEDGKRSSSKAVGMWTLYKKLHLLAASIFLCFAISMFYPVFTAKIVSVIPESEAPRLFKPAIFIPLGFLSWNIGDLIGRLSTLGPFDKWKLGAVSLFSIACLRACFIPLYLLCNIGGHGAIIKSDIFYFLVVSGGFGITNGWLGSMCMMSVGNYVEGDREAASGFMIVNLMAGLTAGSFCSFLVSGVGV